MQPALHAAQVSASAPSPSREPTPTERPRRLSRRTLLKALPWVTLMALWVVIEWLLVSFVHEHQNAQRLDEATRSVEALGKTLHRQLARDQDELQALQWQSDTAGIWSAQTHHYLREQRHLLRVERREADGMLIASVDSPFDPLDFAAIPRERFATQTLRACNAQESPAPLYRTTDFVPLGAGEGLEVMELCLPQRVRGQTVGYTLAVFGLRRLLESGQRELGLQGHELSFIDADGARLAVTGNERGAGHFRADGLVSLPGAMLRVRVDSAERPGRIELNAVSALVLAVSLAVVGVVLLLWRQARLKGEMHERLRNHEARLQATANLAALGEMASLVAHEVNQPFAVISLYARGTQHLLTGLPPEQAREVREALDHIEEQAQRGGQVVHSVQAWVRRRTPESEDMALQTLFDGVMPLLRLQARRAGVLLVEEPLPAPLRVHCDRVMIEQVLLNLVRNAIQASPANPARHTPPQVSVGAAAQPDGRIRIQVRDQGPGISDDLAATLFTPFHSTRAEGMGLGLSLSRSVVEQHHGELQFENLPAPGGAEFSFTLPSARPEPEAGPALMPPGLAGDGPTPSLRSP